VSTDMNDSDKRAAMLAERERLLAEHQHITTAAELAPLMGEHEQEYWTWCLERATAADTGTPRHHRTARPRARVRRGEDRRVPARLAC
jgi:hypothetical protein